MNLNHILDNFEGIIFDFDGTLFFVNLNWSYFKETLLEKFPKTFNSLSETSLENLILKRDKNNNWESWNLYLEVLAEFEDKAKIEPNPKGIALYNSLYHFKKVSIVSNNLYPTIVYSLEKLNMPFDPDLIFSLEKTNYPKPNPIGLNLALQKFSLNKDKVIFIGDSSKDELAASFIHLNFEYIQNLQL
ncbi:MAG: HAD family hydrolase [Ignavibacteria bacterium]|nr:HAD family hydrolase [Ignavibacteria bacterium]